MKKLWLLMLGVQTFLAFAVVVPKASFVSLVSEFLSMPLLHPSQVSGLPIHYVHPIHLILGPEI